MSSDPTEASDGPDPRTTAVAGYVGAGAAFVVGITGLLAVGSTFPSPTVQGDLAKVALGSLVWLGAAFAVAAPIAVLARAIRADFLSVASGWVVAAVTAAWSLDWDLSPSRGDFRQHGPALAWWLAGGLPLLTAANRDGPALLRRTVVVWGAGYAGLWLAIAPSQVDHVGSLSGPQVGAVVVGCLLAWLTSLGVAGGMFGPSRVREQIVALVLAHPFLIAIGPDSAATLRRLPRALGPRDLEGLMGLGVMSTVGFVGVAFGAAVAFTRGRALARRRDRAPDPH